MIKDLNIIDEYYENFKDEYILDNKDGYYLRQFKKLQKKITIEDKVNLLNKMNNPYVKKFIEIMKNNEKGNYLENLYSNLRITKIIDCALIQNIIAKSTGTYGGNYYKNGMIILLLGDKINDKNNINNCDSLTPYHELLHLLTTKIENENIISIGISSNTIGEGLNEGYTEILTERYFGNLSKNDEDVYKLHKWFAEMIEEIITRDIFEKCYFEVDQLSFIKELSKYSNIKKVCETICNLDYLFLNEDKMFEIEKEILNNNVDRVNELKMIFNESLTIRNIVFDDLINIYKNKMEKMLEKREITEEEYLKAIDEFYKKNKKIKDEFDTHNEIYEEYFEERKKGILKNGKN